MSDEPRAVPGWHAALVFGSDAEYREVVVGHVDEGIRRGERVAFLPLAGRMELGLDSLRKAGLDPERLAAEGRLMVGSAEDAYLPGGGFDPEARLRDYRASVRQAAADGFAGFRVAAEVPTTLASASNIVSWRGYELRADVLSASVPFTALCCYDAREWDEPSLRVLRAVHSDAGHDGAGEPPFRLSARDGALHTEGELDFTDADAAGSLLLAAVAEAREPVLDVARLTFADVTAMRALVAVAGEIERSFGRVEIRGASPTFRKVWEALGLHTAMPEVELIP